MPTDDARPAVVHIRVRRVVATEGRRVAMERRVSFAHFVDRALEHYLTTCFDWTAPKEEHLP